MCGLSSRDEISECILAFGDMALAIGWGQESAFICSLECINPWKKLKFLYIQYTDQWNADPILKGKPIMQKSNHVANEAMRQPAWHCSLNVCASVC